MYLFLTLPAGTLLALSQRRDFLVISFLGYRNKKKRKIEKNQNELNNWTQQPKNYEKLPI